MFKAITVNELEGELKVSLSQQDDALLSDGDTYIDVSYSSLNYKDALVLTNKSGIAKKYPLIPGIDLAGTVTQCQNKVFPSGSKVLLNGFGVGEKYHGGLAEKAAVKSQFLMEIPKAFSELDTMAIGTAGYTAMLCVLALEKHGLTPESGEVLVTGATGGVGSVAVSLLSKLGYQVAAVTGREQYADMLTELGASRVVARQELEIKHKPLLKTQWAGVIDVAGGLVLANACAATHYGGAVAACGLAASLSLPATVAPFILRNVSLLGVDSVMVPMEKRVEAWQRLAQDLNLAQLKQNTQVVALDDAIEVAHDLLAGKITGRVVVKMN